MKFRATCPHCNSVFRLTPEQLDAMGGWGQCGVCGAAFNMRTTLAAENGDPLPPEIESSLPPATPDPVTVSASTDIPSENVQLSAPKTPDSAAPIPTPSTHAVPLIAGIGNRIGIPELSSIILIDPDAEVTDDYGPLPKFSANSPLGVQLASAPSSVYRPDFYAAHTPANKPDQPPVSLEPTNPPQPTEWSEAPSRKRLSGVGWALISLVLVLGLLLQLAYFLRDTLAHKLPVTRPWLETACAKLGCKLSLPKDAALIQIIGSDLQAEPAGPNQLQLKLTLGNRAPYAQAWPVVVLTLTDHKDQPQARRSFAPSEYLGDQQLLASGIPAQREHLLSLPLEVRNLTLAGYRLEVVY